jgi:hypothetical protein
VFAILTYLHHLRSSSSCISNLIPQQRGALQSTALDYYGLPSIELQRWVAAHSSSSLHTVPLAAVAAVAVAAVTAAVLAQHMKSRCTAWHSALQVQRFFAVKGAV